MNRALILWLVGIAVGCGSSAAVEPRPNAPQATVEARRKAPQPAVRANRKQSAPGAQALSLPGSCAPAGRRFACNPVTNEGCDAARGEACDDDEHDGFACSPPPNTVREGGECNDAEGPSCTGGMGCDGADHDDPDGICHHYCCSNADCASKRCMAIDKAFGTLGFCE